MWGHMSFTWDPTWHMVDVITSRLLTCHVSCLELASHRVQVPLPSLLLLQPVQVSSGLSQTLEGAWLLLAPSHVGHP